MKSVDFHCQLNNSAHHTDEVTNKQLIVRRGQSFLLTLEMTQPFQTWDELVLTVETGSFPSERRGTRSEFGNPAPMYASDVKAMWKYDVDKSADLQRGSVTLSVTPPADAPVGRYAVSAQTSTEKSTLGSLVVLFNPWCSDDWVYLPDESKRQEYVMSEQGIIYRGTEHIISSMYWDYSQFEEDMVDICLKMLDVNPKHAKDPADDVSARCNPIYVSRVISAMINCNDDHGVLMGCWDGNYSGGVSPTHWLSSSEILRQWHQKGCSPVKYGQCWVFAGVMCSVMRFFGIPCRVVTNFKSAHDTNQNLMIDQYFSEYGVRTGTSKDSVWNFHVWVEGWMKRPDLNEAKFDGWQVLDPTPQEKSQGVFCCGPAPVSAVYQGLSDLKYDVPFVFAEVNADVVKWLVSANGVKRKLHSDTTAVGQWISTKAVGVYTREDITCHYKPTEASSDEREAFKRAVNRLNSDTREEGPLNLEMKIEEETKPQNGEDINLKLKLRSKDYTDKTMSICVNVQAMRYNGTLTPTIKNTVQDKTLPAGRDVIIPIQIPFSDYSRYMANYDSMKVTAIAINKQQEDDIYETETDITLQQPAVSVKVLGQAKLYQTMRMEVEFTNPINETLKNCSLTVTGTGLFKSNYIESNVKELGPKATLKLSITTIPYKTGARMVLADFDCSAFRDVQCSCLVDVKP